MIILGLLRLVCIFIGLAVCSELPADDGVSMFRSFFAFFIMIALDYSRMFIKGKSLYERSLGVTGFIFSLIVIAFNYLGSSKQLILQTFDGGFYIVSSATFQLLPNIHLNNNYYFLGTAIATMVIASGELLVPFSNRYKKKIADKNQVETKKSWFGWFSRSEKVIETQVDSLNIIKPISEGGK